MRQCRLHGECKLGRVVDVHEVVDVLEVTLNSLPTSPTWCLMQRFKLVAWIGHPMGAYMFWMVALSLQSQSIPHSIVCLIQPPLYIRNAVPILTTVYHSATAVSFCGKEMLWVSVTQQLRRLCDRTSNTSAAHRTLFPPQPTRVLHHQPRCLIMVNMALAR